MIRLLPASFLGFSPSLDDSGRLLLKGAISYEAIANGSNTLQSSRLFRAIEGLQRVGTCWSSSFQGWLLSA